MLTFLGIKLEKPCTISIEDSILKMLIQFNSTATSISSMTHYPLYLKQETLTGFKWMGNLACDLMAQGKTVLFSFEEAIGKK